MFEGNGDGKGKGKGERLFMCLPYHKTTSLLDNGASAIFGAEVAVGVGAIAKATTCKVIGDGKGGGEMD